MKKATYILIFVLIFLSILPYVAAQTINDIIEIGPYKQNSIINILVACRNTGGDCTSAALCNMTVNYPNTTRLIFNQQMAQNGTFYNNTIPDSRTIGKHTMSINCYDVTENITRDYFYYVTETGERSSILFISIIELLLKVGIFIFVIVLSIFGIKRIRKSNEENKTPYFMIAILRVLWAIASYSFLFMSPMIALFLFHPNFPIGILQTLSLSTYLIIFILLAATILFNIFWFSGTILMKFGGLDFDANRTNKVLNDMSKYYMGVDDFKNKIKNKFFKR